MCTSERVAIAFRLANCCSERGPMDESMMQLTPSKAAICSSSTMRSTISSFVGGGGGSVPGARGSAGGLAKLKARCSWNSVAPLPMTSGEMSASMVRTIAPSGNVTDGIAGAASSAISGSGAGAEPQPAARPAPAPAAPIPNSRSASRRLGRARRSSCLGMLFLQWICMIHASSGPRKPGARHSTFRRKSKKPNRRVDAPTPR